MHVLFGAGAKTLFLFGPQDPARTGPYLLETDAAILQAPVDLPCRPCLERSYALPEGALCMSGMGAELVLGRMRALLHFED